MRLFVLATLLAAPIAVLAGSPKTVILDVQNMTCSLCPITVKKALGKVPGVAESTVDLTTKTATVTFDPDKTSVSALVTATTNAGFPSTAHQ